MLKPLFENVINAIGEDGEPADFEMTALYRDTWGHIASLIGTNDGVRFAHGLGERVYKHIAESILRNVFLIELVKSPTIDSTKFRTRWYQPLENDPRFCSFDEAIEIARELLSTLPEWGANSENCEALKLSAAAKVVPYAAPIDYMLRRTSSGRIHEKGNLKWYSNAEMLRTWRLRTELAPRTKDTTIKFLKVALADKIKVKTYLTDRAQTGPHKTNREKRWETHPESVQFAERRTCMAIEHSLFVQVFSFNGFPSVTIEHFRTRGIIQGALQSARCPITGDLLSYEKFKSEIEAPAHGESQFQVGHLYPLKLDTNEAGRGHQADNITWISADGNRIQGSQSLEEVQKTLRRIAANYRELGLS